MNIIEIITVQRKEVFDKALLNGVYYADTEKYIAEKKPNLLKPYQYLIHEYGYRHCPIFGCPVKHHCEFYGADCSANSVLIQLSVPSNEIKVQNYYDWTDLIFFMEYPQEWQNVYPLEQFFKDTLHRNNVQHPSHTCRVHQITMDRIEKTWITDTSPVTKKFTKLHIGSGGSNILRPLYFYK